MSKDLYSVLGVSRTASEQEIKSSYRKLAAKLHPDKNPGDATAEQRFKDVNRAYQVLSDKKRREAYDEFGEEALSDNFNVEQARAYKQWGATAGVGGRQRTVNLEDLFGGAKAAGGGFADFLGDMFAGATGGRRGARRQVKGQDTEAEMTIDLAAALNGTTVEFTVMANNEAKPLTVRVPPGATEGSKIRLKGQGNPSPFGGVPGDMLITIHIASHPCFRMEGKDLHLDLPISIAEAYRGAKVQVPTAKGAVTLKVPPGSQSGTCVRLKGKGVSKRGQVPGDLYVRFLVQVPTSQTEEVKQAIDVLSQYEEPLRDKIQL